MDKFIVNLILALLILSITMYLFGKGFARRFQDIKDVKNDAVQGVEGKKCKSIINQGYICDCEYNQLSEQEKMDYVLVDGLYDDCVEVCKGIGKTKKLCYKPRMS